MPRAEEAILLAGGLGTRLRGALDGVPKALAPISGRPFLAFLLDRLAAHGIRRTILATGYLSADVEAAIGARWGTMEIVYSAEDAPLGTGGAIRLASARLSGAAAHVGNADTYLHFDLRALEDATRAAGCAMGAALARVDDVSRYGTVEVAQGRVVAFAEKGASGPGRINAGNYFLDARAFDAMPPGGAFSLERDVLPRLAAAGEIAAFDATSDFIDIGVPDDLRRAPAHLERLG